MLLSTEYLLMCPLKEAFKQHICIPLVRNKYTNPLHNSILQLPFPERYMEFNG